MEGQKVVKVFCHEDACIQDFKGLNGKLRDSANNANPPYLRQRTEVQWLFGKTISSPLSFDNT